MSGTAIVVEELTRSHLDLDSCAALSVFIKRLNSQIDQLNTEIGSLKSDYQKLKCILKNNLPYKECPVCKRVVEESRMKGSIYCSLDCWFNRK